MSPDAGGPPLDYIRDRNPDAGTVLEVAPGVRWFTMPLPGSLAHINLWLLEDGDGVALVDTGIFSNTSKEMWERVFAGALKGRKVTRLIVTHAHPDHIGLAGWLCDRQEVALWITEDEHAMGRKFTIDAQKILIESGLALYRRGGLGLEAEQLAPARALTRVPSSAVPEDFVRLADGMEFAIGSRVWRVIVGRGHAPEHACLWCAEDDIFIAGDQVLPKITPNVSLWPGRDDPDPLGSFLASLDKIERTVPDSVLALPSHNLPFYRIYNRLQQLREHHAARMGEVIAACDRPRTAAELVPILFQRRLDMRQMAFAMGEALAHLQYGVTLGLLARDERADGAWLFQRN